MSKFILTLAAACLLTVNAGASPVGFGFECITENKASDATIGETQFSMIVTDSYDPDGSGGNADWVGYNQVMFIFKNSGSNQSTISEIYFDDDVPYLLSFNSFRYLNSVDGLLFGVGAKPKDLPGGKSFSFSANYSYDPDVPQPRLGINPGEELGILFTITGGNDFDDVIACLGTEHSDPSYMRVGIHAINFGSGGSESFIASPPVPTRVPEPGIASFFLIGLGSLSFLGILKRK